MTLTLDWTNIGDFVLRSRIINVLTRGIKFRCLIINSYIFRRLVHNFMNGRGILWQIATFKTKLCDREAGQSTRVHLRMLAIAMNLSKNNFFNVGSPFILLVPGRSQAAAAEGGGTGFGFLFHRPALAILSCMYNWDPDLPYEWNELLFHNPSWLDPGCKNDLPENRSPH